MICGDLLPRAEFIFSKAWMLPCVSLLTNDNMIHMIAYTCHLASFWAYPQASTSASRHLRSLHLLGLCLQDLSWGRILLKELCQGVLSIHLNKKSPGSPVTQNIQIALKVLKSSFRQISVEISDEFRSASPNHARSGPYNGHDARDGCEGKSKSFPDLLYQSEGRSVFTVSFLECTKIKTYHQAGVQANVPMSNSINKRCGEPWTCFPTAAVSQPK